MGTLKWLGQDEFDASVGRPTARRLVVHQRSIRSVRANRHAAGIPTTTRHEISHHRIGLLGCQLLRTACRRKGRRRIVRVGVDQKLRVGRCGPEGIADSLQKRSCTWRPLRAARLKQLVGRNPNTQTRPIGFDRVSQRSKRFDRWSTGQTSRSGGTTGIGRKPSTTALRQVLE